MHKDLLVLFGGWTRPSPYPLHQPERFFDEIHTYSPSKNWWGWFRTVVKSNELVEALCFWPIFPLISFSVQVELYCYHTWTSTHGWPLFLCNWEHHGGVWGIIRSTSNVWKYYLNLSTIHLKQSFINVFWNIVEHVVSCWQKTFSS